MRLKVIHSCSSWLPQTQTWMYNQVRYLPSELVESHVACGQEENLDQFGLPCIRSVAAGGSLPGWAYRRLPGKSLQRLWFLRGVCKRERPEIVHSHFGDVAWWDTWALSRRTCRQVVTFYGYDLSGLPRAQSKWLARYRRLFARAHLFLCEGPHMARCLVDLGCPRDRVRVHHLGVVLEEIPFEPRRLKPGRPLRVLIAGSFREKKGIPYAIAALDRVARDHEVEVTIVGDAGTTPDSSREKEVILRSIRQSELGSRVRLLGFQPHNVLFREALEHHIFLSPSVTASDGDTEGGAPVTLIELSASGMPVVATEHCDIPNVILDGESGLLAKERDVEGLAERILFLIRHPERWMSMARAGRRHVEKEFDARTQGRRLAELYAELATGPLSIGL